ncbi:50S ribosomal protein L11 methyltransferase [Aurantiacibacter aquimixticola]|uniref:Ribosomal protein L11 methyltransferase n=1 Tax=Aurantiacibacter aquimixticola TaxID=1958945 RepID=A0A419RSK7_9SPHN|nr:50S ribosomal protein L11 methyltransferase [Aurantiacibacter aquimixticola]RJY08771.1 50S ribosomal protein L11 methyltransferase [Aurantiacibacter aquimixticola]
MSWKLSATATKARVEAALARREEWPGWDDAIVLTGFELDADDPDTWQLDAYLPGKPTAAHRKTIRALFEGEEAPRLAAEELPDADWVSESQRGVEPIRAGRFHVHTPDHAPSEEAGARNFCIPAAQAFGTGHHETTAGCLEMLDAMRRCGLHPRHVADIGTGTGLLAFAALHLWPRAVTTATDIDPVCAPAVVENAERNDVRTGHGPGEVTMLVADGMEHPVLEAAAPFDLLIANILAGPLIALAPDFAEAVAPRGDILLSGLLITQERGVRAAYLRAGFRLQRRLHRGDWSILWLRHRFAG